MEMTRVSAAQPLVMVKQFTYENEQADLYFFVELQAAIHFVKQELQMTFDDTELGSAYIPYDLGFELWKIHPNNIGPDREEQIEFDFKIDDAVIARNNAAYWKRKRQQRRQDGS